MLNEEFHSAIQLLQYYYIQYEELEGWTFYETSVLVLFLGTSVNIDLIKLAKNPTDPDV